jgi:hypothetical protein
MLAIVIALGALNHVTIYRFLKLKLNNVTVKYNNITIILLFSGKLGQQA